MYAKSKPTTYIHPTTKTCNDCHLQNNTLDPPRQRISTYRSQLSYNQSWLSSSASPSGPPGATNSGFPPRRRVNSRACVCLCVYICICIGSRAGQSKINGPLFPPRRCGYVYICLRFFCIRVKARGIIYGVIGVYFVSVIIGFLSSVIIGHVRW